MEKNVSKIIQEANILVDKYLDNVNEGIGSEIIERIFGKKEVLETALKLAKKSGDSIKAAKLMNALKTLNMAKQGQLPNAYIQRLAKVKGLA